MGIVSLCFHVIEVDNLEPYTGIVSDRVRARADLFVSQCQTKPVLVATQLRCKYTGTGTGTDLCRDMHLRYRYIQLHTATYRSSYDFSV